MHYAIDIVPFGEYSDPRMIVQMAVAAEKAGWEAVFVWDHLGFVWGAPAADPWVTLSACAQATSRIRLGTAVTPVPRHRPHMLAATLANLDRLSGGRVIFGAGLGGVDQEFTAFGEPGDARVRAEMLDEGLELIDRLLSGEPVTHIGSHYTADNITLAPLPVQQHIPFWIGGESRPALRRAARWDGWMASGINQEYQFIITPEDLARSKAYLETQRMKSAPIEIALEGKSEPGQTALLESYAEAGVTWWLENLSGLRGSFDELLARIDAGPQRYKNQTQPQGYGGKGVFVLVDVDVAVLVEVGVLVAVGVTVLVAVGVTVSVPVAETGPSFMMTGKKTDPFESAAEPVDAIKSETIKNKTPNAKIRLPLFFVIDHLYRTSANRKNKSEREFVAL